MRPSGRPSVVESRRLQAIDLLRSGFRPVDVARRLGVDRRSVRRWKRAYRLRGKAGLRARPNTGRPSSLDARQRRRLERVLLKGARAIGFDTDLWTCPRIAVMIRRTFNIGYHVDHISRLMRSLGWTPQRPERRATERDEEGIQGWRRLDWPRVKKKPVD